MTVDKVIAKIIWLTFFGPPCIFFVHTLRYNGEQITRESIKSPDCIHFLDSWSEKVAFFVAGLLNSPSWLCMRRLMRQVIMRKMRSMHG